MQAPALAVEAGLDLQGFEFIDDDVLDGDADGDATDAAAGGGCRCRGACGAACACAARNGPLGCAPGGLLLALVHGIDVDACLFECGPACACGPGCAHRPTQRPPPRALALRAAGGKGVGLFAAEDVPAGAFVCSYVGEHLRPAEAARRLAAYDAAGRGHALLTLIEEGGPAGAGARTDVDATRRGGAARFANHRCGGGSLAAVAVRRAGRRPPAVALFAARRVRAGEELTFSYGAPGGGGGGGGDGGGGGAAGARRCLCGAPACAGVLPAARGP